MKRTNATIVSPSSTSALIECPVCHTPISLTATHQCTTPSPSDAGDTPHSVSPAPVPSAPFRLSSVNSVHPSFSLYLEKLKQAGIDTSGYFSILGHDQQPLLLNIVGGVPVPVEVPRDEIEKKIYANGYLKNNACRRFLPADYWRLSNDSRGFSAAIRSRGYEYSIKVTLRELKALWHIAKSDRKAFSIRSMFFSPQRVYDIMKDDLANLNTYISSRPVHSCKGVKYVRIGTRNIFLDDIPNKVTNPLESVIRKAALIVTASANDDTHYAENAFDLYLCFQEFVKTRQRLSLDGNISASFIHAYKGAGAYYFLQNLIQYHGVCIKSGTDFAGREASLVLLDDTARRYSSEPWRLVGYARKVVDDNGFDFGRRLHQLGVSGY